MATNCTPDTLYRWLCCFSPSMTGMSNLITQLPFATHTRRLLPDVENPKRASEVNRISLGDFFAVVFLICFFPVVRPREKVSFELLPSFNGLLREGVPGDGSEIVGRRGGFVDSITVPMDGLLVTLERTSAVEVGDRCALAKSY